MDDLWKNKTKRKTNKKQQQQQQKHNNSSHVKPSMKMHWVSSQTC